jgi:septum site-determining protein MinC
MEMTQQRSSLRFCSRAFHALALKPEAPLNRWLGELDSWLTRSPEFFGGKAIVLDVSGLDLTKTELVGLTGELCKRDIRILGVEGADPSHADSNLPSLLTGSRHENAVEGTGDINSDNQAKPGPASSSLLIDSPVRSGQSIIHDEGDVTIIGSVASAAEIIAAGSVHVYGTLRGRVLAGAFGDRGARIFCWRLQAELLAIDGNYLLAEDIPENLRGNATQAWLNGTTMEIALQK